MSGLVNPVTTEAALNADLVTLASKSSGSFTIDLGADIDLSSDLEAISLAGGVTLTIDGEGHTVNGGATYRGLFVTAGNVTVENLSVVATAAIGGDGGSGSVGGGGGAGLGGGLFVAASGTVTLSNVDFSDDIAKGGAGGNVLVDAGATKGGSGGGGGMGGAGGNALRSGDAFYTAAGGGGIGAAAVGAGGGSFYLEGHAYLSGAGIVPGATGGGVPAGSGTGATFDFGSGTGGGGGDAFVPSTGSGAGGGGGVSGGAGSDVSGGAVGGAGGFGGGGGGASGTTGTGGTGGFGGGGGGAGGGFATGGYGGFGGGGGGASGFATTTGLGGTGGGAGGVINPGTSGGGGGGGLGAGGDVFVQQGGTLVVQAGAWSDGTVTGGAAGTGATAGQAAGTGLFLQGNQTVTLDPGAGKTLTISDGIVDEAGAFGGDDTNEANLVIGAGTVRLLAADKFEGSTTVEPGGTLELGTATSAGGNETVFTAPSAGAGESVIADSGFDLGLFVVDFVASDTIDFKQLAYPAGGISGSFTPGRPHAPAGTLTIDTTPSNIQLDFLGSAITSFSAVSFQPDGTGGTLIELACYATGTRVLTAAGERAIETLRAGELVPDLVSRKLRRIVWIGRKTVFPAAHPRPCDMLPVRVRQDAFGPGAPHRDLIVSPDHGLLVDGALVPARRLIDGRRIVREHADTITYWHVELDAHGVLLAEGMPAESYLDTGAPAWASPNDRASFTGGAGAAAGLFVAARREARACLALAMRGGDGGG